MKAVLLPLKAFCLHNSDHATMFPAIVCEQSHSQKIFKECEGPVLQKNLNELFLMYRYSRNGLPFPGGMNRNFGGGVPLALQKPDPVLN